MVLDTIRWYVVVNYVVGAAMGLSGGAVDPRPTRGGMTWHDTHPDLVTETITA